MLLVTVPALRATPFHYLGPVADEQGDLGLLQVNRSLLWVIRRGLVLGPRVGCFERSSIQLGQCNGGHGHALQREGLHAECQ